MANKIKAHSTIGSVSKATESGYVNIGGVWKPIVEAYNNVGGVWKSAWEVGGIPVANLAVGSSVWLNVSGVSTEFIIVQHGTPDTTQYGTSFDNGTWLLMKDCYEKRSWSDSYVGYDASDMNTYLNNTFYKKLDSTVRNAIINGYIPYTYYNTSTGERTLKYGSNGLRTKVFLLSVEELAANLIYQENRYAEGVELEHFVQTRSDSFWEKYKHALAYYNGELVVYWTRTIRNNGTAYVVTIGRDERDALIEHDPGTGNLPTTLGVRPAFVVSNTLLVDENYIVIV